MKRKEATQLKAGDRVKFKPIAGGSKRLGTVESDGRLGKMVSVQLDGDPFPIYAEHTQIERTKHAQPEGKNQMTTKTNSNAPTTRELRVQAKQAGVEGWDTMEREELERAVKATSASEKATTAAKSKPAAKAKSTAKKAASKAKATAKKAPAKKAAAKKAASTKAKATKAPKSDKPTNPNNPWREGTNMWHITEALLVGGKRSAMVKKLRKKVDVTPRDGREIDTDAEIDRRMLICAQLLVRDNGFTKEKEGRGADATLKVTPPR